MAAPDGHPPRRFWLCADDYAIAPGVDAAIRDLVQRGRLNATSVMVVAPAFRADELEQLTALNAERKRVAIGLHLTLTAPFRPLTSPFEPLRDGRFLPLGALLQASLTRRLRGDQIAGEVAAQLEAFARAFGHAPDFVDGHQHVHLFPQIRGPVLAAIRRAAPHAWVRQCGRRLPLMQRLGDPKGLFLDALSGTFRRRARAAGVRTNPAFAGTYAFRPEADFAALFPSFLAGLPENAVVMCHPGVVDAELTRLDPLTDLRAREYAYLRGDEFPRVLARHGLTLAPVG